MSLSNYAAACSRLACELKADFTREDIDELRSDCVSLREDGWILWKLENTDTISAYVSASPSERLRKKAWQDPQSRRRLVLASIQHVLGARALLSGILDYKLEPGKGYRETAALAGKAYLQIFLEDIPAWPFPGDNPFPEGR